MEVVLNSLDSYQSTGMKACDVLGVRTGDRRRPTKITLLRMSGAVIPDTTINGLSWTIGRYVEHTFSARSRPTIGVHIALLDDVSLLD